MHQVPHYSPKYYYRDQRWLQFCTLLKRLSQKATRILKASPRLHFTAALFGAFVAAMLIILLGRLALSIPDYAINEDYQERMVKQLNQ